MEGIKEWEMCGNIWGRDGEPGMGEESLGEETEIPEYPGESNRKGSYHSNARSWCGLGQVVVIGQKVAVEGERA